MTSAQARTPETTSGNLVAIFLETAGRLPYRPAAREKVDGQWVRVSWAEMERRARAYARGLIALGVKAGDRVSVIGHTRVEWVVCELGAQMAGAISVPIYHTNPPHDVEHIVRDSGAVIAFADTDDQVDKFRAIRSQIPQLRQVITTRGAGDKEWVLTLDELVARGEPIDAADLDARIDRIGADEPACFIYTSGTTGAPKGVVLTHANWTFEADATEALKVMEDDDEALLYLPLAHSYAQVSKAVWFRLGHPVAFVPEIETLMQDLSDVRPTALASVPRIFEKVYTKVVSAGQDASGVKGRLFAWAMGHFERYVEARKAGRAYESVAWTLARRLVFRPLAQRLRGAFGGRIRYFVSGGAPLSPTIAYFFDLCGMEILEGYGLTETSAGAFVNRPGEVRIGTVGTPFPGVEVRIADDGEVLMRGPNIMKGYHNNPEATREAIDEEGWFRSGDIGEIDDRGYLRITDRKKDLIVTAGGKNIAPQKLENRLKAHPLISQVLVHGDRRKFLSALVTLDPDASRAWAADRGVDVDGSGRLGDSRALRAEVQAAIDALNGELASVETIKKFAVLAEDFSQENGELTPTLKVKRRIVEKRYRALLDGFYSESF